MLLYKILANLGRIPSNSALIRRGVPGVDARCSQCLQEDEDIAHILIRCHVAATEWEWVFKWCDSSTTVSHYWRSHRFHKKIGVDV